MHRTQKNHLSSVSAQETIESRDNDPRQGANSTTVHKNQAEVYLPSGAHRSTKHPIHLKQTHAQQSFITLLAFLVAFFFFFVFPFPPFSPLPEETPGRDEASLAFMLAQISSIFDFWPALMAEPSVSSGCGEGNGTSRRQKNGIVGRLCSRHISNSRLLVGDDMHA